MFQIYLARIFFLLCILYIQRRFLKLTARIMFFFRSTVQYRGFYIASNGRQKQRLSCKLGTASRFTKSLQCFKSKRILWVRCTSINKEFKKLRLSLRKREQFSKLSLEMSWDFRPPVFFHDPNPSWPLINRLKYFRIRFQFCELFDHRIVSAVCNLLQR